MLFIPGWLISLLTFPGVIVHEISHRLFCDIAKIPVYRVCYFRIGNPAGYVIHGPAKGLKNSFLISVSPIIVNTFLCAALTFSAIIPIFILKVENYSAVFIVLLWIGFSIGMHAFPSNEDIENFSQEVKKLKQSGVLFWMAKIFSTLIKTANSLSAIWFDAIYACGITMFLPWLLGVL